MTQEHTVLTSPTRRTVRCDWRAIRDVMGRVKDARQLADLRLFRRRCVPHAPSHSSRNSCTSSVTRLPIHVTPADFDGRHAEPVGASDYELFGIATYVSRNEIDFLHNQLLIGDHAVVAADFSGGCRVELLLEVRRANVERRYTYMSGGRFIGIVDNL